MDQISVTFEDLETNAPHLSTRKKSWPGRPGANGVHNIARDTAIAGVLLAGQDGGHNSTVGGPAKWLVQKQRWRKAWSCSCSIKRKIAQINSPIAGAFQVHAHNWYKWSTLRRLDCQVDGEDKDRTHISLVARSTNLFTCRRYLRCGSDTPSTKRYYPVQWQA